MNNSQKKKKRNDSDNVDSSWIDNHKVGGGNRAVNLPKNYKFFAPKEADTEYQLRFIPYKISKNTKLINPNYKNAEKYAGHLIYHCHNLPNGDKVVCSMKMWGSKCAVCDFTSKLTQNPDQDEATKKLIKDLKMKERQLFNIINTENPKPQIEVWDISTSLFAINLQSVLKAIEKKKPEKYKLGKGFLNKTNCCIVGATAKEKTMGMSKPFLEFPSFDFTPCDDLEDWMLEKAVCLDDCLVKPVYADVMKLLTGGENEEDEEEGDEEHSEIDDDEEESDDDGEDDPEVDDDDDGGDEDQDEEEPEEDEDEESGTDDDDEDMEDDDSANETDDDEIEEDNVAVSVGDIVYVTYKKKKVKGKVVKVNDKNKHCLVRIKGLEIPQGFKFSEVQSISEDDDPLVKKVNKKPIAKKMPVKNKKPAKKQDDDDDDAFVF